jgi:N-formylmaleamate deformylase
MKTLFFIVHIVLKCLVFVLLLFVGVAHAQSISASSSTVFQSAVPNSAPHSFVVKVTGHGPPMILIPGFASSGETWDTTAAHYENHFKCYVLTLAGFAGVPPIHTPLLATVVEDLAAYIKDQHLTKPIIVGHSLGGNVAMDLAARHPELVGPVVIVDSLPFYAGAWFDAKSLDDAKASIAAMHAYMAAQTHDQYVATAQSGAATKFMVTDPARWKQIIGWSVATDQTTAADTMAELVGEDLRPELARISAPTLVLGTWVGLKAQLAQGNVTITRESVQETFERQFANLPALHFVMSETARHFIMFDDPNWFFARLDAFLADPIAATKDRGFSAK